MSRLRYNRQVAVEHLRSRCGPLRHFIDDYGGLGLKVCREIDLFNALARAIVYQQLSGKAAATIHGRFTTLFNDTLPEASQAGRLSDSIAWCSIRRAPSRRMRSNSAFDSVFTRLFIASVALFVFMSISFR